MRILTDQEPLIEYKWEGGFECSCGARLSMNVNDIYYEDGKTTRSDDGYIGKESLYSYICPVCGCEEYIDPCEVSNWTRSVLSDIRIAHYPEKIKEERRLEKQQLSQTIRRNIVQELKAAKQMVLTNGGK